ncbi:MAG TPA: aldehyde dehydrogenase family protein [Jatrophihabitantaceae bacterium]|jgi:NADP-dependent aldehyde dehydrogenase|nr:aldehyde dehydrogenase family protein [Jatrophihabitantaceae bacterium]
MTAASFDPRTGSSKPAPPDSTVTEIDAALAAARTAAAAVASSPPGERQQWLTAIADALRDEQDRLVTVADAETALGNVRLNGELERAAAALRFYGTVAAEGSWLDATIDHATDARPDLRRTNVPLGPVAIFGASNFPFGFGVLGHDTGSAIAAGCPVVVKAHPAHPRLSAELGAVAAAALERAGAPAGTFALVHGYDAGVALVTHPDTRAVAFTGSQAGGMALWRAAAGRERAIPVYAEMGTVNAVVVTPAAGHQRAAEIAAGFVTSFTLGMGQFCTKPGLLLAPRGADLPRLVADALTSAAPGGWLLTDGIATSYAEGVDGLTAAGATVLSRTDAATAGWAATPTVLTAPPALLTGGSPLLEECFGPVALVVEYDSQAELDRLLDALPGALAGAVHCGRDDDDVAYLVDRLSGSVGRVVVNDWPTGVAVTWAQHHGGPWPATSDPSASSVGAAALRRFVRPVAYQAVPDNALPPAVQEANPWRLSRRVDGTLQT